MNRFSMNFFAPPACRPEQAGSRLYSPMMNARNCWLVVAGYAVAMAWVEAAVVFYLRTMINRVDPYQANPLPNVAGFAGVELIREAATLIMLFTVGLLAGGNWRSRWGYAAIAFGIWDIFYYVFLKLITHWPHSALDWDVLFLLPLPWWGPVLAPVIIACLMIFWGTLATQWDHPGRRFRSEAKPWLLNLSGIVIALYVFMADAIRAAPHGEAAVRAMLPTQFAWGTFTLAAILMSAPAIDLARKVLRDRPSSASVESREPSLEKIYLDNIE